MRGRKENESQSADVAFARQRRVVWASSFLIWLALGIFSASSVFVELPQVRRPNPQHFWPVFASQLMAWLVWTLVAPVTLQLRRWLPLERGKLLKPLVAHLLAIPLLCALHTGLALLIEAAVRPMGPGLPGLSTRFVYGGMRDLPFCALFYGVIFGIGSALDYYRQFREREVRAAQLEAQLAQAELQMLRMQLNPHFLFNTLNGITGLVRDQDNSAAVQMLVRLSDLLRQTLENSGKQEVPLREEIEWLELYLNIQQMRFSDRLQVQMDVAPETLDALIPNLITQPLVENAICHGLARRAEAGSLSLTARREDGRLELCVCDDGVGLPEGWQLEESRGLGLANTVARLRQLYHTDFRLQVSNRRSGGVEARLSIPLRAADPIGNHDNGR